MRPGFRRLLRSQRTLRRCFGLVVLGVAVAGCQEVPSNLVEYQPYEVQPIDGTDLNRVTLDDRIAARIDLQTTKVQADGKRRLVPHAALIYNPDGDVFVYTRAEPETYVRAPVKVSEIIGDDVVLSKGPSPGTVIVTVGAAELLATEYEILNQHP
jgi:hypothetical protein